MALPTFQLERYFGQYEFSAEMLLCCSDMPAMTVGELLGMSPGSQDRFLECHLGYTESAGAPSLRQAIASHIYTTLTPDHIMMHCGAEEGIYAYFHTLVHSKRAAGVAEPHIIVMWPCYTSLSEVARTAGARVTPWRLRQSSSQGDWSADFAELEAAVGLDTCCIVINTPHNPTGYLMSHDLQRAVLSLAERNSCEVFSDEVYSKLESDPALALPSSADLSPNAVSLNVLSKSYGLAGLRIGWIATKNSDILRRQAETKDYLSICNAAPSEFLAEVVIENREAIWQKQRDLIQKNVEVMDAFFCRHRTLFVWKKPLGGCIAFPSLTAAAGMDAYEFCEKLVQSKGVMLCLGCALTL
jgi:aspartate/methionine/tyrosine aminotransferase